MSDIDLNLLRIFNVLYEERDVNRISARLFFTQSAVGHSLARLRNVLDDPFFVRIPSGLEPIERAHQFAPRRLSTNLAQAIDQQKLILRSVLSKSCHPNSNPKCGFAMSERRVVRRFYAEAL